MPSDAATTWPTPTRADGDKGTTDGLTREGGASLTMASGHWPTPQSYARGKSENSEPGLTPLDIVARGLYGKREAWSSRTGRPAPETPKRGRASSRSAPTSPRLWTTPTAGDGKDAGSRNAKGSAAHMGVSLTDQATTGDSTGRSQSSTRKLNPRFVEWLMGFPIGWTERDSTGDPKVAAMRDRRARLAALGNAVVPDQAAEAIRQLAARSLAGGGA